MIQNQGDLRILETVFLNTYIRPCKKDKQKEKALEKEKRKEEREGKKAEKMKKDTGLKKMPTQEASVKSTNEKTRKGKGKATVKHTS